MNNDILDSREQERFGKDALLLAGAILLTGLIIAGALVATSQSWVQKKDSVQEAQKNVQGTTDVPSPAPKTAITLDRIRGLFNEKNLTFGKKDSQVLFVEFSDPSCPYCQVAAGQNSTLNKQIGTQFTMVKDGGSYVPPVPEIKKMVDEGKAGFVWIYANGHGNGEMGTKALYCAQEQGKFWEAHDLLMNANGYKLMNTDVKNDVTKVGILVDFLKGALNANTLQACLESGKYDDKLKTDMELAQQFDFGGTPGFFVNTTHFNGAYSFKDMQSAINEIK
ncbi:MAG: DsbA family protein [Minisyncoccota bacterium]